MQVIVQLRQVTRDERSVGGDRVAAQRCLPGLGDVPADVTEHLVLRFGQSDAAGQFVEQARTRVHVAHQVGHLVERFSRRLDHHVDAVVEFNQFAIGDHAGDLDQRVAGDIEAGHLAVNPDQSVSHRLSLIIVRHRRARQAAVAPPLQ